MHLCQQNCAVIKKSGEPEETAVQQHPHQEHGFQRILAPQITDGALPGVFPRRALAIWGCLPPTTLTSHPDPVPGREAVSHEPTPNGYTGLGFGAGRASRRRQRGQRVQTGDRDERAPRPENNTTAWTPAQPSALPPTVPLTTQIKPAQRQAT